MILRWPTPVAFVSDRRLGGRYIYLAQSTATGARLQIGDRTGDGICDLTIDGTLLPTDPAATVITTRTTVPPLVDLTTEAAARNAIAAAGLTAGTTTYVHSVARMGTVLAQSASAGGGGGNGGGGGHRPPILPK